MRYPFRKWGKLKNRESKTCLKSHPQVVLAGARMQALAASQPGLSWISPSRTPGPTAPWALCKCSHGSWGGGATPRWTLSLTFLVIILPSALSWEHTDDPHKLGTHSCFPNSQLSLHHAIHHLFSFSWMVTHIWMGGTDSWGHHMLLKQSLCCKILRSFGLLIPRDLAQQDMQYIPMARCESRK